MDGSAKSCEYNFHYAVGLIQWSMKLLGLWPLDERFSTLKLCIGLVVTLAFLIPSMTYLLNLPNWQLILEQAITTVPLCLLLLKLSYLKAKSENFKLVLKIMIDDWARFEYLPKWGRKIMIRHAKIGRRVNIICISCMSVSIMGYMTLPAQNKDVKDIQENVTIRKLPTQGLYPFDPTISPTYEIIYASQIVVSFLYCVTTFSVDCFLAVIVFHACGQLSTLSKILERYNRYTIHAQMKDANAAVCACLKCIIDRHVFITSYMEIVEKSFNEFVLLQVISNCFILAAEGYLLAAYAENSNAMGALTFVMYTTTVTYNIFIYCYIGECIIQKSGQIENVAYNLEWNNLPRHLAQPLILLMIRSRRPCKITAGGFAVMSLSYYKKIITTSLSYISVLRAIR